MWKNLKYPRVLIPCGYTSVYKTQAAVDFAITEEEGWTVSSLLQVQGQLYVYYICICA